MCQVECVTLTSTCVEVSSVASSGQVFSLGQCFVVRIHANQENIRVTFFCADSNFSSRFLAKLEQRWEKDRAVEFDV